VWLSKENPCKTAWHIAARRGDVGILEKLWDFAKKNAAKTRGAKE